MIRITTLFLLLGLLCSASNAQAQAGSKILEKIPEELRKTAKLTKKEVADIGNAYSGIELKREIRKARISKASKVLSKHRSSQRIAGLPEGRDEKKAYLKELRSKSFKDDLTLEERKRKMLETAEARKRKRLDKN